MAAMSTITKILRDNYRLTAPAEQQQFEGREKQQYSKKDKNMDDMSALMEMLGPLVQLGLIPKDKIQKAAVNPTQTSMNELIELLSNVSQGGMNNGRYSSVPQVPGV